MLYNESVPKMKRGDSMVNTNVFLGLMKIAGYSQKSLAKEIGMSENTMSLNSFGFSVYIDTRQG